MNDRGTYINNKSFVGIGSGEVFDATENGSILKCINKITTIFSLEYSLDASYCNDVFIRFNKNAKETVFNVYKLPEWVTVAHI